MIKQTPPDNGREKFLAQLEPHISTKGLKNVETAYVFAKYGHRGQKRDSGGRYFEHPKSVANILINELNIKNNWKIISVALLHDILEDSRLFDESRIKSNFGPEVTHWVSLLTKKPAKESRGGYYDEYYKCIENCRIWQVLLVKFSDRLHNLREIGGCDKVRQKRYLAETRKTFFPLADVLIELLPQESKWRGEYLKKEIRKTVLDKEMMLA